MAPPPEYDKEPKAPDKSATNISCEETKALHNLVNDQQSNSDNKSSSTAASADVENNKLVETLDDGQLRALLDEAITYKCPKDREGKSNLFKELLEEVEQDEQASEAAARGGLSGSRAGTGTNRAGYSVPLGGRGSRSRRALPHSNSLQDLVAALAAEPAPRRHHRAHPAPAPAPVSTRAIHGGSLPSGVDTSFLLGEEPTRGAGYLATVRCVNPPPLGERRVSATDANCLSEVDSLNRRSKPAFPMTYTARATLEIGSGSVCSGRAVTTTTASNQVRTSRSHPHPHRRRPARTPRHPFPTAGPPERLYSDRQRLYIPGKYYTKNKTFQSDKTSWKMAKSNTEYVKTDEFAKYYTPSNTVDKPKDNNGHTKMVNISGTELDKEEKGLSVLKEDENETEPEHVKDNKLDCKQNILLSALFKHASCDNADNKSGGGSKANMEKRDTFDKNINKNNKPRGPQQLLNKKQETEKNTSISTEKEKKHEKISTGKTGTRQKENKAIKQDRISTERKKKDVKITIEKSGTRPKETKPQSKEKLEEDYHTDSDIWLNTVNTWYENTDNYSINLYRHKRQPFYQSLFEDEIEKQCKSNEITRKRHQPGKTYNTDRYQNPESNEITKSFNTGRYKNPKEYTPNVSSNICFQNMTSGDEIFNWSELCDNPQGTLAYPVKNARTNDKKHTSEKKPKEIDFSDDNMMNQNNKKFLHVLDNHMQPVETIPRGQDYDDAYDYFDRQYQTRQKIKEELRRIAPPELIQHNPKNVRRMTIGKPLDLSEFANDCAVNKYEQHVANEPAPDKPVISKDTKQIEEELDIDDICVGDTSINLSVRSSTPIPEQNFEVEIENTEEVVGSEKKSESTKNYNIILGEGKIAISSEENCSKSEDLVEESIEDKGTVTVLCQPDNVYNILDNSINDLCSSQDRNQSCDVEFVNPPSQEEENNIELFDVRPIDKSDASFDDENDIELVDMSLPSCENKNNKLTVLSDFIERREEISFSTTTNEAKEQKIQNLDPIAYTDVELSEMSSSNHDVKHVCQEATSNTNVFPLNRDGKSFSKYLAVQRKLLLTLEASNLVDSSQVYLDNSSLDCSEKVHNSAKELTEGTSENVQEKRDEESQGYENETEPEDFRDNRRSEDADPSKEVTQVVDTLNSDEYYLVLTKQPDQLILTLPPNNNLEERETIEKVKSKKKKKDTKIIQDTTVDKATLEAANKKILKAVMFDYIKKYRAKLTSSQSSVCKEVDSAIPFSCITTPEVVASCNTTSSTSQSAVSVDPKPRSVIPSSFNGLPLTRPNYGATGNTTQEEFKKSIDENGNSVQGFSSPLSGSSQHKKPRRKKSSKNETVIKSHQIDGYQGNKDLNEVLRFIESAADTNRAGKLPRAKHRDDADDKGGKKRSGARKDKESKMKRATSMEELSRTTLEDLTDKPSAPARTPRHTDQAKAERRSWGDDARSAATRFFREDPGDTPSPALDSEFQTVTKKRKPRRRGEEPEERCGGHPPRAARAPSPRARRVSAPPSDRSNDSNDDMDSVHSLPADAVVARPAAVSYADIARTRHNIPDLIESCNFYSEGERDRVEKERAAGEAAGGRDADGYPALEARAARPPSRPHPHPHPHKPARAPPAALTKVERTECVRNNGGGVVGVTSVEAGMGGGGGGGGAPDVVADRRPAVILLDSSDCRDMDGVTFGFDINHQLLGGVTRRPRCDLVRDALEGAGAGAALPDTNGVESEQPGALPDGWVTAGCLALRYVPPAPPADTLHLHQIIDYVAAAWEDVVRCGAGKVRYYSE